MKTEKEIKEKIAQLEKEYNETSYADGWLIGYINGLKWVLS